MQCAQECSAPVTTSRQSLEEISCPDGPSHYQMTQSSPDILAAVLRGQDALSREDTSLLASRLHSVCALKVGPAELMAALQVAKQLIWERQESRVIAGSGLVYWLLNLMEDLVHLEERAITLDDVLSLVTHATALLLVAQGNPVSVCQLFHSGELCR